MFMEYFNDSPVISRGKTKEHQDLRDTVISFLLAHPLLISQTFLLNPESRTGFVYISAEFKCFSLYHPLPPFCSMHNFLTDCWKVDDSKTAVTGFSLW
jgi:hypothetical protein